jgi:hypothetical protein
MFKHSSKRNLGQEEFARFIDGFDVYNARLLDSIRDAYNDRVPYEIRTFEYRPDLIAEDIYGSTKYTGLFMLSCGVGIEGLKKGATIQVIQKQVLDKILSDIVN